MYDLEAALISIGKRSRPKRKEARKRMRATLRQGKLPSIHDVVEARGLILREREDSIFSDAWLPIAWFLLLLGLIGNRNPALLMVSALLILMVYVSKWWKNRSLIGVSYNRAVNRTHVFPNEPIQLTLSIRNQKWLPLTWLEFRDQLPIAPDEAGEVSRRLSHQDEEFTLKNSFSIAGYEQKEKSFTLSFAKRGFKQLGPVTYRSGDIFTIYNIERTHNYLQNLVVYPQIWTMEELGLPAKEPFGPINARQSLFTDPLKTQSIRDYQPTDRLRDVHWKATARRGALQTKMYDPSTDMTIVIFLNVATMARHWHGHYPELMERAVSVAGSLANYSVEQKWAVGLIANGSLPGSDQPIRAMPSRSPEQLLHILEALAAVTQFATASIEKLMVQESPGVPWAATIILVTAVLTDELLTELIRLRKAGRRLAIVYLGKEPSPDGLDGIIFHHISADLPELNSEQIAPRPNPNGEAAQ